jgi:hypothetical protein
MAKYEVSLKTAFGEIRIPFDSQPELEERLKELDISRLSGAISSRLGALQYKEVQPIKPGLEKVCRFRPDGLLELLTPPKTLVEAIGLVVYAYDPEAVEVETIRKVTGADNPVSFLGSKSYEKYFDRPQPGRYKLTHQGKIWVTSQIIPRFGNAGGSNA